MFRTSRTCPQCLSVWLPVPPLAEQTAIACFLDQATDRIDRYVRAKARLFDVQPVAGAGNGLIVEYRDRLIADVVMGRLDVRQMWYETQDGLQGEQRR